MPAHRHRSPENQPLHAAHELMAEYPYTERDLEGKAWDISYDNGSPIEPWVRDFAAELPDEPQNLALHLIQVSEKKAIPWILYAAFIGPDRDFEMVRKNPHGCHGCVMFLQHPMRFLISSPWCAGSSVDLALLAVPPNDQDQTLSVKGIFASRGEDEISDALRRISIPQTWKKSPMAMVVIPLVLLQQHIAKVDRQCANLSVLLDKLEHFVKQGIKEPSCMDSTDLLTKLYEHKAEAPRLDKQYEFGRALVSAIWEFINFHDTPNMEDIFRTQAFQTLKSDIEYYDRLSQRFKDDIELIHKRVETCLSTVIVLINQRDADAARELARQSATIAHESTRIAEESARIAKDSYAIAEATRKDSTGMTTIAIMTLVFLPGTFLCSFFSMTFFDWSPAPGEPVTHSLWVYFAAAVPLTLVVMVLWLGFTRSIRTGICRWLAGTRRTKVKQDGDSV